ncbi:hypothetical protein I3760_14G092700 [Carya illinoinensis]|nr:hypothetical protein I3760_14G092700 [Carya illinoinensis]
MVVFTMRFNLFFAGDHKTHSLSSSWMRLDFHHTCIKEAPLPFL